jgi:hypothetical protein
MLIYNLNMDYFLLLTILLVTLVSLYFFTNFLRQPANPQAPIR